MTSAERRARFEYLTDGPPGAPAAQFAWRLLAGNNRPLGRSDAATGTLDAAMAGARTLRDRVTEVEARLVQSSGQESWTWRALLDGVAVATGVRPYLRRIECVRSFGQFLAGVNLAEPEEGVLRHFGPTSLRAYAGAAGVSR